MEFHFFPIFALLIQLLLGGRINAHVPADVYWHSVLPNTPLPKVLKELLPSDVGNKEAASFSINPVDDSSSFVDGCSFSYSCSFTYGVGNYPIHNINSDITNVFFLYDSLRPGKKMNLLFEESFKSHFIPREIVDSIPFSSDKLPKILDQFNIKPNSVEAKTMEKSIKACEVPKIKGEENFCATSLESLVDFGTEQLGKKVMVLSNEVDKEEMGKKQEYEILRTRLVGEKQMACHRMKYPYAVYYCHTLEATKVYKVSLMAANGVKVKALAICHFDTSAWNPQHIAFQLLKVKPGGSPVCHFLSNSDAVVWIPK